MSVSLFNNNLRLSCDFFIAGQLQPAKTSCEKAYDSALDSRNKKQQAQCLGIFKIIYTEAGKQKKADRSAKNLERLKIDLAKEEIPLDAKKLYLHIKDHPYDLDAIVTLKSRVKQESAPLIEILMYDNLVLESKLRLVAVDEYCPDVEYSSSSDDDLYDRLLNSSDEESDEEIRLSDSCEFSDFEVTEADAKAIGLEDMIEKSWNSMQSLKSDSRG